MRQVEVPRATRGLALVLERRRVVRRGQERQVPRELPRVGPVRERDDPGLTLR
ncbi:hypothetical protein [Cellulomonas sp. A375-1]|uniref:hypothetical protein n=1 Tax=Cellulomonas sp. A375-1 TaxID=1672219 RepID=UPI0012E15958|nr:hypothetical protein [Cellulomonas sp. A375-1]